MNKRGTAGRLGEDVRSDCYVAVDLRSAGGVALELESKVAPYYGAAIREQAYAVLDRLGVKDAQIQLNDHGALPYVIEARIEAAVRATGAEVATQAPTEAPPEAKRGRLRRSRLYLPGNEPKFMINAGLHGPDGIILDLEDSVHPNAKDAARILVRQALAEVDFHGAERMVRINQLPLGLTDLDIILFEQPDLILIPKVEDPEQVIRVDERICSLQKNAGIDRTIWIMPILESALGVENAFAIARASERVCSLTIGLEDYTADLGVTKTTTGEESAYARARLVNAARAAGVQAIDSVYGNFGDLEGLERWGERSRSMGYEGMGCIHPSQIEVIHRAFAPTEQEITRATKIVEAFKEAEKQGIGVVNLGSKMIDPPVVERAKRLFARARAMGLIREET